MLTLGLIVAGCDGPQSALDPRGHDAEKLAELFWVMSVASVVIWAVVMAIAVYAVRREGVPPPGSANLLIIGGGVIFSIAVIAAHLIYGFALMTSLRAYVGAG